MSLPCDKVSRGHVTLPLQRADMLYDRRTAAIPATLTLYPTVIRVSARALHICSSYPAGGTPRKKGSVIYTDYQRNMMSKGKLQLCARPTGRQGWEAAQTEWMYLLFM